MTDMTDPSVLPQHKGHPVPWVTRWTGQTDPSSFRLAMVDGKPHIEYPDGLGIRDQHGVLWMRESLARTGTPEFSQMSTYRQRASMIKRLCQVCGTKIPDGPIKWLIANKMLYTYYDQNGNEFTCTLSPPTCEPCIPLALSLCPHLKKGHMILSVEEWEPYGVFGEAVIARGPGDLVREQAVYKFGHDNKPGFSFQGLLGKQMSVQFTKYSVIEGGDRYSLRPAMVPPAEREMP